MRPSSDLRNWGVLLLLVLVFACNNHSSQKDNSRGDDTNLTSSGKDFHLNKIKLPEGFSIAVYAQVPDARSMCIGEKGTVFVGNKSGNSVYALRDENGDGKAEKIYTIISGLNMPNGVAFRKGSLYVAEVNRISRFDAIEDQLNNPPKPVTVYDRYPTDEHHGWKFIAFGPDDKLYVPVGAPCNICDEKEPVYASITRLNPDGTGMEIFAKGVRNSVGFDWDPQTRELWFTDNGRDYLGDDVPNCELNHAPAPGLHFGYPYCHEGGILDPEFGKGKNCSDYVAPAEKMGPHVAPLGMRFYKGDMFPPQYEGKIFIAQHGSWNRTIRSGYRVMMVSIENNKVVNYQPFATGWLQDEKEVLGRPVDILVMPDGSILISDDQNGAIYRVTYQKT